MTPHFLVVIAQKMPLLDHGKLGSIEKVIDLGPAILIESLDQMLIYLFGVDENA